jgi:hypothetical protein
VWLRGSPSAVEHKTYPLIITLVNPSPPCSLSFPLLYFEHTYIWLCALGSPVCVCVCVFIWVHVFVSVQCLPKCYPSLHVSYGQSLQTESLPLAKTGSIQASPPEGCMWKSTGKGHQVTFYQPAGILPQLLCMCVSVRACVCVFAYACISALRTPSCNASLH